MNVLKEQLEANAKLALDWVADNQIKANPSKFQTIIFKHRGNEAICELNISNDTIKPVSCVKLLGVTRNDEICCDDHISRICTRAARQINALRRILKYVPLDCRINIYNAFIASNFNYCKTVWHFCSNRSAYKIEKVNKKALRATLNDYESPYRHFWKMYQGLHCMLVDWNPLYWKPINV